MENETTDNYKFKCDFPGCDKVFSFKGEYTKHCESHSTIKNLKCPYENCWKYFKRADTLENHIRLHTGEKPFACKEPNCDMKFANKAGLRYHMLKHKNVKSYACTVPDCNKKFLTLAQLKQHEQSGSHALKVTKRISEEGGISPSISTRAKSTDLSCDNIDDNFDKVSKRVKYDDLQSEPISLLLSTIDVPIPFFPNTTNF